eukprot:3213468-Lingulodinium_polyedra.AAC.1
MGWGISGSGVGHGFSAQLRLLQFRGPAPDETKMHWMVFSMSLPADKEVDVMVGRAQELRCESYGIAREAPPPAC